VVRGSKKRHAGANPSVKTTHLIKQARQTKAQKNRRHVAARNYEQLTQSVIGIAQHLYRCYISAENPYPTTSEEVECAARCWVDACRLKGTKMEFDNDFRRLVRCTQLVLFSLISDHNVSRLLTAVLIFEASSRLKLTPSSRKLTISRTLQLLQALYLKRLFAVARSRSVRQKPRLKTSWNRIRICSRFERFSRCSVWFADFVSQLGFPRTRRSEQGTI
jgi:hypothetical protein